ncbi:unnamed protein product [Caenorhabditis angaria]|uniref:Uncharacterized protein n=1 Tax=Caenorhabditis angaria TaxID=860376 RepID=A0A9P1N1F6_9PELO|nr:unnamed protein product [Caenorhabditis angaria]
MHKIWLIFGFFMVVLVKGNFGDEGGNVGENEEGENKFAELFQQMMAKHREQSVSSSRDCQLLYEDCSSGPKRTKLVNFFVRY